MKRYDEPGLSGLELWRGISRGATLFQLRERKAEYFAALREFLVRLHRGEAESSDAVETVALRRAAGFARTILCGGEALHPSLGPALGSATLPFGVEIDTSGPYAAQRGALRIFESMGWSRGAALDLGQLQLKVMAEDLLTMLPRDESLLPFGPHALDDALGRSRLRAWIAEALTRLPQPPDGVVLALPVALSPDAVAQSATYPGLFGPVAPIFDELFECPWVVLNDAVLAALGFPPRPGEKTLVITLGFGIGGALWEA